MDLSDGPEVVLGDDFSDLSLLNQVFRTPMWYERQGAELLELLRTFVDVNADPGLSPNYERAAEADDLSCLLHLFRHREAGRDPRFVLAALAALKILLRKQRNRVGMDEIGARTVVDVLRAPGSSAVAREVSNVMLNLCYESMNVVRVVQLGAVGFLVAFLEHDDDELVTSALGALQSICFTALGRQAVRDAGAVPLLVELLKSACERVRVRAAGTLHNVSSDAPCVPLLREAGAVPLLVAALREPVPAVCSSAAGALQNLSREQHSRDLIRGLGAVGPLADLLVGDDMQAQVCAAGALLNIVGPELGDEDDPACPQRAAFRKLLSDSIATAAIYHVVYDERTKPFLQESPVEGEWGGLEMPGAL